MRQLTHYYCGRDALHDFVAEHQLTEKRGLIQVFSGVKADTIASIGAEINRLAPHFSLIGGSTGGEMLSGRVYAGQLVIHVCVFEQSTSVELFALNRSTVYTTERLLSQCKTRTPKLAIIFADAQSCNPEDSLAQIGRSFPGCKVVGAAVAPDQDRQAPYLLMNDQIKTNGLVGALLSGDDLSAEITCCDGWRPVGRQFTVTEAKGNQVFSLDNVPILDFYQSYLGDYTQHLLSRNPAEFPLLLSERAVPALRTAVGFTECQQGIVFAGRLKVGDKATFAYTDDDYLLSKTPEFRSRQGVCTVNYSCFTRRSFLNQQVNEEVQRITGKTQGAGGFFYSQFASCSGASLVFNLTSTVLQLAETRLDKNQQQLPAKSYSISTSARALANLASKASTEQQAIISSIQQHHKAIDASSIISVTDANGVIKYVNDKFEQISGYSSGELLGNTHRIVRHPKMRTNVFQHLWQTISDKQPWYGLIRNRKKNGDSYYVKTAIYPILDNQGNIQEYVSVRNDVTDIVKARRSIQKQSTDALTQLHNRAKLSQDLEQQGICCVAVLDLKNFKLLNDYWGIEHGDKIIKALARELKKRCMAEALKLYHLNGAAFAIRPAQPVSFFSFRIMIADIKANLESTDLTVDEHEHEISFSVGIGASADRALAYAESAIIEAKSEGISNSLVTRTQDSETDNFYFWLEEVKQAFKEQRVIAYFQAIAPTTSDSKGSRKYEALARLQLKNGDIISPHAFLNFLKKTRHYRKLTQLMLVSAVEQSKQSGCFISVNLSIQDLLDRQTVDYIISVLEAELEARIIFEITESEAITDFKAVKHFINSVRSLGAQIAIDDFGSGYSNFIYLVELKPDFIKIDGSIIKTIKQNPNSRHVAQTIIDLAQGLGIETVAEFVSDQPTFELLKNMGAEYVQGFYIAEPLADIRECPTS
ncbi:EAL domain-containing protein [Idiomarina seosinensis]|uniref:bifunctional diguanylate cyclase/phosphodiesterase n=1 Tax=Idiomarina seosinensis TaxID=281739 RepID=UPI00384B558E